MLREHGFNFFLSAADSVVVHGMAVESPGYEVWLLALGRDPFKEIDEGLRIVTGCVLVFNAQQIGFAFKVAAELHESHGERDAGRFPYRQSNWAAHEYQRDRCQVPDLRPGGALCGVARGHVGNLM